MKLATIASVAMCLLIGCLIAAAHVPTAPAFAICAFAGTLVSIMRGSA